MGMDALAVQLANEAGEPGEQVLLDVNAMAAGKDYFSIGEYEVSQDNRLLAWAQDDVGRRQYTIHFRNLETGETYPDVITGVSANVVDRKSTRLNSSH